MINTAKNNYVLSKKLLYIVLVISSVLTILFTSIRFYIDFIAEKELINSLHKSIQNVVIHSLAGSIYHFDIDAINIQMRSLSEFKEITSYQINDEFGKNIIKNEVRAVNQHIEKWNFPIEFKKRSLGFLYIWVTKKYMYQKLGKKILIFFITQGLKTLLVSILILLIFNKIVIGRINKINDFIRQFEKNNFRKRATKEKMASFGKVDELDFLNDKIHIMMSLIIKSFDESDKEISLQKSKVINASKLAAIGEMAGGIAHEINNPLAIIDGNNSIINTIAKKDEHSMIAERSDIISRMVIRVQSIILALRKFSREENSYHFESVKIKSFINETLYLCREKFKSHGVKIECIFHINPNIKFNCNQVALSQVFINILNNGYYELMKHNQATDRKIVIEIKKKKSLISFSVKNNGGAITKSISEKIFQPFFTTKKIGEGTGLGMSVAKGIIEQHKGTLSVKGYDNWTEFIIEIPE